MARRDESQYTVTVRFRFRPRGFWAVVGYAALVGLIIAVAALCSAMTARAVIGRAPAVDVGAEVVAALHFADAVDKARHVPWPQ